MDDKKSIISKIVDNFKNIKKISFNNYDINNISSLQDKINDLSVKVSKFSNLNTRNVFSDLIKYVYNKNELNNQADSDINKLLEDFDINQQSQSDRFIRYDNYKEIVLKISYAKRALQVIKDNIISPDDYTINSLKYFKKNLSNTNVDTIEKIFKEIIEKTGIYENLDEIIETCLLYGDYFIEIVDSNEILKNKKIIKDNYSSKKLNNIKEINETINFYKNINEEDNKNEVNKDINLQLIINESFNFENIINENKKLTFDDIFLEFHSPENVIIIGEKFCFGYLIFPKENNTVNIFDLNTGISNNSLNKVINKIIKNLNINDNNDEIKNNPELRKMIAKLLLNYNENNINSKQIRYVSVDKMQHFKLNSINNRPYGKSIFFGQEFLAKILILIQTTIGIQRITNSGDRRIVNVEIGLPRDAKNIVEQMKKKFKRKRYSIDDIGTIKEIPSQLSSFETLYLPMKDGKRFIEFDSLNDNKNISERVEDFNAIRDSFVAGLLVPPAYVGLEENVESKSMLSHENIIFSRLIVNLQKIFSSQLTQLVRKIYNTIYGKNYLSEEVEIIFSKPKSLKLEMDNEYYNNLINLINTFKELGYSDKYIKNKYILDDIDPVEMENLDIKNKMDKLLEKPENEEEQY